MLCPGDRQVPVPESLEFISLYTKVPLALLIPSASVLSILKYSVQPGVSTFLPNLIHLLRNFKTHLWGLFHSGQLLGIIRIFIYLRKLVLPVV